MTHTPKERPILFSTPMVQALLDGRKTQTRRIITRNNSWLGSAQWDALDFNDAKPDSFFGPAYLKVGNPMQETRHRVFPKWDIADLLWVKETYAHVDTFTEPDVFGKYLYKSMGDTPEKWKPAIFMPKEAARIWLRITGIRVERVQDISEQDAVSEGIYRDPGAGNSEMMVYRSYVTASNTVYPYISFKTLWQSINGQESWDANPWVWVIEFEVISKNGKPC